ncbi:competence/damage-inducible protein A [Thermovenabulum gondwanense]|uniref:Putative competence-damage inducible protein n=1 Tax=Thermovenabulum gondwanense TaxID=520767 RepID=A0A162MFQ9_9FIRM|nr:competence/damage-inducible protein A [Thermovenabulum gondwanense]KYO65748.1 putative competence-damage inducible protein [Thermovenabulum gondwanense]
MKAEIICVGTELLLGDIVNTNAYVIARALKEIGIDVYYHTVVGDNFARIKEVFLSALKRSDIIITTGGLGPTRDDITKDAIAEALNLKMIINEEALIKIEEFFKRVNREFTKNNLRQALIPETSQIIPNEIGLAPGVLLEKDDKIVIMLPGPPFEMEPMLYNYCIPYLQKKSGAIIFSRVLKFYGIGESSLEEKLIDLIDSQSNPTIAPYAKMGEVTIRITAKAKNKEEAIQMIIPIEEEIKRRVGNYIYAFDDQKIEDVVAKMLIEKGITIAIAESCTGGLISHKLTNVPGISKSLERAVVSYSNKSKIELLEVNPETIEKTGAVSEKTAEEMAMGIRINAKCDIGLSITGIAGPDGGTLEKPVGLVYIGYSDKNNTFSKKFLFKGKRQEIKERAANAALQLLREKLLEF